MNENREAASALSPRERGDGGGMLDSPTSVSIKKCHKKILKREDTEHIGKRQSLYAKMIVGEVLLPDLKRVLCVCERSKGTSKCLEPLCLLNQCICETCKLTLEPNLNGFHPSLYVTIEGGSVNNGAAANHHLFRQNTSWQCLRCPVAGLENASF